MKICDRHEEAIPLISTMAFNGAEYWCPFCGANYGIFNGCEKVEETEEMIDKHNKYKELSRKYLNATGSQVCDSLMHEGKRISPDDLPEEVKEKNQSIIDNWEYGQTV